MLSVVAVFHIHCVALCFGKGKFIKVKYSNKVTQHFMRVLEVCGLMCLFRNLNTGISSNSEGFYLPPDNVIKSLISISVFETMFPQYINI